MQLALLIVAALGQSVEKTPQKYLYSADKLPPPFATVSAMNFAQIVPRGGAPLYTAPGYQISAWATGLDRPRKILCAPDGDVFAVESFVGRVTMLRGIPGSGPRKYVFAKGLNEPYGIAFYPPGPDPKYVYIAETNGVSRFPYVNGDTKIRGKKNRLFHLPGGGYRQHWTRNIVFRPDGKYLFTSVGSSTNASIEGPPRAGILESNPDGSGLHVYASGLRNPVGMAFEPKTGDLWTAVNERDKIGDDLVPDFATQVRKGGFYGWPYYYIGNHHDPRLPSRPSLGRQTIVPDVLFESHSAALGIAFPPPGSLFGSSAYVSMHGSWNRKKKTGYKVVRLPFAGSGHAEGGYEDFAWGWQAAGDRIWGRPVDVTFDLKGNLLVSDDANGTIWRISKR